MIYFSIERPVSIGTYPKPQGNRVDAIVSTNQNLLPKSAGLHGGTSSMRTR